MKVAFLGATKGMGRALARAMALRGDTLCLLGRDASELEKSAADLRVRGENAVAGTAPCDLSDTGTFESALEAAQAALGGLDAVIITAGLFDTQDNLEQNLDQTEKLLQVNFSNTILFCEHARARLMASGGGTLCVFSSVAGDRGRKPVILYGASKAGLSYYLEGLDHKFRAAGLKTICVKPGFVKTGMTAGLDPPPFAGEPDQVAQDVLKAIDKGKPVVYTPKAWWFVMAIIKRLPRFVMRRIGF